MTNFVDILECADTDIILWEHQKQFLSWYQANYDKYDFFVCQIPVGGGKSRVATAVASWCAANGLGSTTIICMTKMLQDQYGDTFQWLPVLKGADNYPCTDFDPKGTCGNTRRYTGKYCEGRCNYRAAMDRACASETAILNPWNYEALGSMPENPNKFYRPNLVIDEAHGLVGYLFGSCEYKIWRHIISWKDTDDLTDNKVIIEILGRALSRQAVLKAEAELTQNGQQIKECEEEIERLHRAIGALTSFGDDILVSLKEEVYHGKPSDTNHLQMRQCIHVKPRHVDKIASRLWPTGVQKVLFMSATIGPEIIEEFGIDPSRVGYFECDSPIPKENRRCVYWPIADMSYKKRQASMEAIITAVLKTANRFPDQKGFIHATYDVARQLKNSLSGNSRFIFHDKYSKKDEYKRFRDSKHPLIMVGSGMSEGIDLAGDAARWQIITVVQFPSLADDVNKWRMMNEKTRWLAETCRIIQQQYGRVCRGPSDHGITIILDQQFWNLLKQTKGLGVWPKWFMEALEMPKS
jgi:hypothetical protein